MMLAFTAFFFVQVGQVPKQWKTSVAIAGLVTGVAFYNYTYMKDQWVVAQSSPTVYRYTDWLITVPLQIMEFYFILKAAGPVDSGLGVRLFLASILMILGGWMGETGIVPCLLGFVIGMVMWFYILYEVFAGEASGLAARLTNESHKAAFNYIRMIVLVGWTIYPAGYAAAYLTTAAAHGPMGGGWDAQILNMSYNLADLVNKGLFGLCVWSAAISDKSDALLAKGV